MSFENICHFFNFGEGNLLKIYQILHFFGALRANIASFEIHYTNFTTGSLSFLCKIGNSYRFVKFWPKKGLEFLDLLSFFLLEFSQKWSKKKPVISNVQDPEEVFFS